MPPNVTIEWSADHLRISLFSGDLWATSADEVFHGAFGFDPESVTKRPAANEIVALGIWEGNRIEVKTAFNRVDFVCKDESSSESPIAFLANIHSVLPDFSKIASSWAVTQSQRIIRIAVGCNAFLKVDSIRDSYVRLQELIRVINVDVDRFSDFRFQVNLPVQSSVMQGLQINRLTNWGSIALRAGLVGADNTNIFSETNYVSCVLDVNTDADRKQPITPNLIRQITDELCSNCLDILDRGIS